MTTDSSYVCSEDVLESKIDEEIILMSLGNGFYYGLDEIASRIWELLKITPMTLPALCQVLQAEFDVSETSCQGDTLVFLQHLTEQGLVRELSEA